MATAEQSSVREECQAIAAGRDGLAIGIQAYSEPGPSCGHSGWRATSALRAERAGGWVGLTSKTRALAAYTCV